MFHCDILKFFACEISHLLHSDILDLSQLQLALLLFSFLQSHIMNMGDVQWLDRCKHGCVSGWVQVHVSGMLKRTD